MARSHASAIECAAGSLSSARWRTKWGRKWAAARIWPSIARTAVRRGFTLDQAVGLEDFEQAARAGRSEEWILPLASACCRKLPQSLPCLPMVERRVRHGSQFQISLAQIQPGRVELPQGATAQTGCGLEWKPARLRVFNQQDQLIAIAAGDCSTDVPADCSVGGRAVPLRCCEPEPESSNSEESCRRRRREGKLTTLCVDTQPQRCQIAFLWRERVLHRPTIISTLTSTLLPYPHNHAALRK